MNVFSYSVDKAPCLFHGHCGSGISNKEGCHIEFNLNHISKLEKEQKIENLYEMISTWNRVLKVLNSVEIADLLWEKLEVLEKRQTRKIRLINKLPTTQVERIHSDSPHTIATIIFMFPNNLDEILEYGTCLFSPRSKYSRSIINATNCSHKVRFFPNSAFMFRTVPGRLGGRYQYDPKRKAITFGTQIRRIYRGKRVSFPSWHATPLIQYNRLCEVMWRKSLFLTFPCSGKCRKKWGGQEQNK